MPIYIVVASLLVTSFGHLATLEASRGSRDILLVGYTCSWTGSRSGI